MSVSSAVASPRYVPCPTCRQPALFSSLNLFRPFCSERCRVIDLGGWADNTYIIPVTDSSPEDEVLL